MKEQDSQNKANTDAANIEVKRYQADLKSETDLAIAQMKEGVGIQEAINSILTDQQQQNDDTLSALVNSILSGFEQTSTTNIQQMQGYNDNMARQLQAMTANMNQPRRVVYGEDGETPIGIE